MNCLKSQQQYYSWNKNAKMGVYIHPTAKVTLYQKSNSLIHKLQCKVNLAYFKNSADIVCPFVEPNQSHLLKWGLFVHMYEIMCIYQSISVWFIENNAVETITRRDYCQYGTYTVSIRSSEFGVGWHNIGTNSLVHINYAPHLTHYECK